MKKEIKSLHNPLIAHFLKLKKDKNYRAEQNSVIIEGVKLVKELSRTHKIKNILTCDLNLAPQAIFVSETIIKKISSLEKSEGILAEVELPSRGEFLPSNRILALDHIQDPGNMGSLLRSALAFNFNTICLVGNCVDPYNDKALRAARGATFHLRIYKVEKETLLELRNSGYTCIVADIEGKAPSSMKALKKALLILGNEAHGPSFFEGAHKICIPMQKGVESLNVAIAGSILMYLL